jgi:zinc protease
LRGLERAFAEREKTASSAHADEYVSSFTNGEPIPGIAYEFDLAKQLVPGIQLDEINRLVTKWTGDKNRVITVNAPEKAGVPVPTSGQLLAVVNDVSKKTIAAYADAAATGSLLASAPRAGSITKTETTSELGVTRWTLSNGIRVILKPTDFKADQILVHGTSPGGTSLLAAADFARARAASLLVTQGGVGQFNRIDLQKALTGKAVSVSPSITDLSEDINATGSPKDIETLFQLMHLYFTAPRADSAAVLAFKQRQKAALENRGASPEAEFSDTLQVTLTQHHPRTLPISPAVIDSLDLTRSMTFYRDRFGDAGDFTFVIVGTFAIDSIRPLVETYLASLPTRGRVERWRDVGIATPRGVVKREVKKGAEPKSITQLVFSGPFEWSRTNRYVLSSLAEVMRLRLRDVLREDLGGTYGVDIESESARDPRAQYQIGIGFGSDPGRAEQLTRAIFQQIDSLKRTGPTAEELEKVREIQRREYETGLRENNYWVSALSFADQFGEDPKLILERRKLFDSLTAEMVKSAAQKYLDSTNYVQVRLLPRG